MKKAYKTSRKMANKVASRSNSIFTSDLEVGFPYNFEHVKKKPANATSAPVLIKRIEDTISKINDWRLMD
jgi:hypothetical protein